jgi:hypothetical protein
MPHDPNLIPAWTMGMVISINLNGYDPDAWIKIDVGGDVGRTLI